MLRFEGREEFFGSVFYDFENKNFISFYINTTETLKDPKLSNKDKNFEMQCNKIGLLKGNKPNYYFIKNESFPNVLSAPLRLHLAYTAACNLRCAHCLGGNYVGKVPNELTYKEKIDIYNQMVNLGIREILIGGGEPFIKEDFVDFLREGAKRDINQKVFTNGLLLNEKIIDQIKDIPLAYLSVSLDGACDKSYYEVRHVSKFDQVVDTCKQLTKKVKFPVVIQTTATRANINEIDQFLEIAAETGVSKLKIRPLKPGGSILKHSDLVLSALEYLNFIKTAQEHWTKNYKNKFSLDYSWGNVRLFFDEPNSKIIVDQIPQPHMGYGCLAGKISMFIDPAGKTFPCVFLDSYINLDEYENVRCHSLKDIWKNGPTFNLLRNLNGNTKCMNCRYYGVCRGGCIARILYAQKKMSDPDPWCLNEYFPLNPQEQVKVCPT